MNEYKSVVGKKLIEILMFSMYPDAKIIYREYIQNSRDAINDAVKAGVLQQFKDGHIVVNIDNSEKKIQISDNGIGVPTEKVETILLNIADSTKDGVSSAGQFGIGRLVGGGFCKKLSFKTSFKSEKYASEITFDVEKARAILDDDTDRRSASEVIDAIAERELHDEDENKHYFIVTLDEVRLEYPELLNSQIISEYLKEVAPIDYQMIFKNQLVQTSIPADYVELQKQVGYFQLSINEENDIRKKYGLTIVGTGDRIDCLHYFTLPDDTYGNMAWGWYAITPFTKAIPNADNNSCFRLRKHNIQVGDPSLLTDFFPKGESRGNKYFYGEIHILNNNIKLNSARDGLAPTPESEQLKRLIRDYFDYLVKLYHSANDAKKATENILTTYEELQKATPEDLPEVKQKWEDAQEKWAKVEHSKNTQTPEAKKMLNLYKDKIQEAINTAATEIIREKNNENIEERRNIVPPPPPPDTFAALRGNYSEDKIELIKRILKSFTDNCPIAQKKLIEELKKKVIKDLGR